MHSSCMRSTMSWMAFASGEKRPGMGEGAGDVAGVAAPLAAGVEDDDVAALEGLVVCVVVEGAGVGAAAGDDGVGLVAGAGGGAAGLEDGLDLGLVLEVEQALRDAAVGGGGDGVGLADHGDLVLGLDDAGLVDGGLEGGEVDADVGHLAEELA